MSHWDGKKIVRWAPHASQIDVGWWAIDCGCCAGIQWGGEEPVECRDCGGGGYLWLHEKSGLVCAWPGGPIATGRMPLHHVARELNLAFFPERLLSAASAADILKEVAP